jgi:hypothetical protein
LNREEKRLQRSFNSPSTHQAPFQSLVSKKKNHRIISTTIPQGNSFTSYTSFCSKNSSDKLKCKTSIYIACITENPSFNKNKHFNLQALQQPSPQTSIEILFKFLLETASNGKFLS